MGDEYGPYIYHFDVFGDLIQTIQQPQAVIPLDSAGQLSFTSSSDPVTGRSGNQGLTFPPICSSNGDDRLLGFEGLIIFSDGNTLLQSAAIQDGGDKKSTLVRVVPLPLDSGGKTLGVSELHYVKNRVFLITHP